MLTEWQKRAAQAIVNVFETGTARGDYANVTLLRGDSGHLTYGRSQTTLSSGNLHLLVKAYCEEEGALFADALSHYLARLAAKDISLDNDAILRGLLQKAGADAIMQQVQDEFFDRVYWEPSLRRATESGIHSALGVAIVYDSTIHGSWKTMRDRTNTRHGTAAKIGEKVWLKHYLAVRREWLATHPNTLLHKTTYRMDALRELMKEGKWQLEMPFKVRGVRIDKEVLNVALVASAADRNERTLFLHQPHLRGADVREVQRALKKQGFSVAVDGDFGPLTAQAVSQLQRRHGLRVDGIVGPATRAFLGI